MTPSTRKIVTLATVAALFLAGCAAGDEPAAQEPQTTATTEEAASTEEPSSDTDADADVDASATVAPEDAANLEDAQEILDEIGYIPGADEATCDAVFGPEDDAVFTMFIAAQSITDSEALEYVEDTVVRIEEIAAAAPTEAAGHLETLAGALALSTTFEGRSQLDEIMADTETSMTGIGEYCFGA